MTVAGEPVDILATAPSATPLGSATNWVAVDRSLADRAWWPTSSRPASCSSTSSRVPDLDAVTEAVREIAGGVVDRDDARMDRGGAARAIRP